MDLILRQESLEILTQRNYSIVAWKGKKNDVFAFTIIFYVSCRKYFKPGSETLRWVFKGISASPDFELVESPETHKEMSVLSKSTIKFPS